MQMKWNSIVLVILLVFVTSTLLNAQASEDFMSFKNFNPPSPEVSLFQRYGDIPVDLSSGIPAIDIPLYEIRSGQLSLPISISYHASGIKVEDMSSPVGLGWVLNAGGLVSRNVIGHRDEYPDIGFLSLNNFLTHSKLQSDISFNAGRLQQLTNLAEGTLDGQSDQYYINIPGLSCRFLYDTSKVIHCDAVNRNIIINRDLVNDKFIITDDMGTKYFFTQKENTLSVEVGYTDPTSWMLTKILSNDGADSIVFKYINASQYTDFYVSNQFMIQDIKDAPVVEDFCNLNFHNSISTSINHIVYDRLLLDSIIFSAGKMKLNYQADREDPIDERLVSIILFSKDEIVKKIGFNQSYFISNSPASERYNKRLRLDKVDFCNGDSVILDSYSFNYNSWALPAYRTPDGYKTIEYDYWGYFNANGALASNNKTLIPDNLENSIRLYFNTVGSYFTPSNILQQYYYWASNRNPNDYVASACILNKINYPTGGYTTFEYEGNQSYNGTIEPAGGLRIKGISSYDINGTLLSEKKYIYGEGDSEGAGTRLSTILPYAFNYYRPTIYQRTQDMIRINCQSNDFVATSNSLVPINYNNGSPVFYSTVTEYEGNTTSDNGKTIYSYEFDTDKGGGYDLVRYGNFSTNRNWIRGQLINTKVFDSQNNLKKEVKDFYSTKGFETFNTGFICENTTYVNVGLFTYLQQGIPTVNCNLLGYFDYLDVKYDYGIKLLTRKEEYDYFQGTIMKQTNYYYDSQHHLYLSKKETQQSDNSFLIENYKYPQDKSEIQGLSSSGQSALDNLVAKNILVPVIEKNIYRDNTFLEKDLSEYKLFSPDMVKVGYRKRQLGAGRMQTEYTFNYDIHGNVVEQFKENDIKTSILWGYYHQLPIANIDNASLQEVQSALGGSIPNLGKGGLTVEQISILHTQLPKALISTFTYKNLVGLTSQTDSNGVTTYYEYDGFGRLKCLKDNDGNILKTYDYHYAN